VFFPPGNYRLDSGISALYDDQTWMLDGAKLSVNFVGVAVTMGSATVPVRRVALNGGEIRRVGTPTWTTGEVGLRLLAANNCICRDQHIVGFHKGIEVTTPSAFPFWETTSNLLSPKSITSCKLPLYFYANEGGAVNENIVIGGEVNYPGDPNNPSATGAYAITIDRHASAAGNVNGLKFLGTYLGNSLAIDRPSAVYLNGNACQFMNMHVEGFPLPYVVLAGDADDETRPANVFWGGGADFLKVEDDLAIGSFPNAPYLYSGRDGVSIASGGNSNAVYTLALKGLGAVTKNVLAIQDNTGAVSSRIDGAGWLTTAGRKRVLSQVNRTTTTVDAITALNTTVVGGRTYTFLANLYVDADAVGGFKFAIEGTCSATSIITEFTFLDNATRAYALTERRTTLGGSAGTAGPTAGLCVIRGTITVNTGGLLLVQFAQNIANNTSSVLVGSTFIVEEIV
jgi:hypothetical protein